jgi:hypothetical protein
MTIDCSVARWFGFAHHDIILLIGDMKKKADPALSLAAKPNYELREKEKTD